MTYQMQYQDSLLGHFHVAHWRRTCKRKGHALGHLDLQKRTVNVGIRVINEAVSVKACRHNPNWTSQLEELVWGLKRQAQPAQGKQGNLSYLDWIGELGTVTVPFFFLEPLVALLRVATFSALPIVVVGLLYLQWASERVSERDLIRQGNESSECSKSNTTLNSDEMTIVIINSKRVSRVDRMRRG